MYRICSPSRCALQSGRNPVHVNVLNSDMEQHNEADPLGGYQGIPLNMTTVARKLSNGGYATHAVGKWCGGRGAGLRAVARRSAVVHWEKLTVCLGQRDPHVALLVLRGGGVRASGWRTPLRPSTHSLRQERGPRDCGTHASRSRL